MDFVLLNHAAPDFQVQLFKGNHYTILIRKEAYLSKRMEAFVNAEACIFCFEKVGDIRPDVSDNLTERNLKGVLLENVELEKVYIGKEFQINNLLYKFNSSKITSSAATILDDLIILLKDNPYLKVELGSHTDSIGGSEENLRLSKNRAQAAVNYILNKSTISKDNLSFEGYSESKIINHCADGVWCSEEDNLVNRRAEIKILGIDPNIESISLADRIKQDKEDELIDELLNQEQIYIEGANSEDVLKELNAKEQEAKDDVKIEQIVDSLEAYKETVSMDLIMDANQTEEDLFFDSYYSIAFKYSKIALDKTNPVFWNIQGDREYTSSSGHYIYHVGHFTTEREAINYNKQEFRSKYPFSFIVKFDKGEMNANY